ncbi:hypothetical protein GGR54DRAFT_587325 [Hypoxylon sp. NC1633]|nr:hypothetical protein GGR54DRAFT_587325 [Hypoxylon sp. NC1633]
MLANLLHSLANDAGDSDGVAQLVVTALGSSGQHYVCWKTRSGEYRQQSNGLPKALQDWLFPPDGSTRDFETLQVILSGEDTFWASDRSGEVRSEPQQRLRRALTFNGESAFPSSASRRRATIAHELTDAERPRSNTLPSMSPTVDHLPGPHSKPSAAGSHSRSSSADKLRRISLVSLAFNQPRRSWATRPRSLVYGHGNGNGHEDLGVLKEQPSPRRGGLPPSPARSLIPAPGPVSNCNCTCGRHDKSNDSRARKSGDHRSAKPRIGYADASVQTDPAPDQDLEPDSLDECPTSRRRKHNSRHDRRESSSSTTSTESYNTPSYINSSKRSSFETVTTQPDPVESYLDTGEKAGRVGGWPHQHQHQYQQWQQPLPLPNPVMMGRMQDYFRSSTYILGTALQS